MLFNFPISKRITLIKIKDLLDICNMGIFILTLYFEIRLQKLPPLFTSFIYFLVQNSPKFTIQYYDML